MGDYGESDNGDNTTTAKSLPNDTVINDHVASVVMVDESTDGNELKMDEVLIDACDEKTLSNQGILLVKMNKKSPMKSVRSLHQCSLTLAN